MLTLTSLALARVYDADRLPVLMPPIKLYPAPSHARLGSWLVPEVSVSFLLPAIRERPLAEATTPAVPLQKFS